MLTYGASVCAADNAATPGTDAGVAQVYYDGERVFFQVGDYTGDHATWDACAQRAEVLYKAYVNNTAGGACRVAGWQLFPEGLYQDWVRNGDTNSRDMVSPCLAFNASFAGDTTPAAWTQPELLSREVAYNIDTELDAESIGAAHRSRTDLLISQAQGHIDQWIAQLSSDGTVPDFAPFMASITVEALIKAYDHGYATGTIPGKIKAILDYMWTNSILLGGDTMYYRRLTGPVAAPDLNLLIAPAYAWYFYYSHDTAYRDHADQLFNYGVLHAFLNSDGKRYDQNYKWSFNYINWRKGLPYP